MSDESSWRWTFLGFESDLEGRPVQTWFFGLPDNAQDEIRDLIRYLRNMTNSRWQKPAFDPLEGGGGISELRPDDVSHEEDGEIKTVTYRIYGFFGPKERKNSYTFLHGTDKKERNDKAGKQIAKDRLGQLGRGEATVHEFQEWPDS